MQHMMSGRYRPFNQLRAVAIATAANNMDIRSCICGPGKLQRDGKIIREYEAMANSAMRHLTCELLVSAAVLI